MQKVVDDVSGAPSIVGVVMEAEKVTPSAFLLFGIRKDIQP